MNLVTLQFFFFLWCLTCLLPLLLHLVLPRLPLRVLYCCSEYCSGIHQPIRRNYKQNFHTCRTAFLYENLWTSKSIVAVTDLLLNTEENVFNSRVHVQCRCCYFLFQYFVIFWQAKRSQDFDWKNRDIMENLSEIIYKV